jgi:hypothetical protein
VDSECSGELHIEEREKYCVRDGRQDYELGEMDAAVQNFLFRVILEILVRCCVFIAVLLVLLLVLTNNFICLTLRLPFIIALLILVQSSNCICSISAYIC